MESRKIVLTVLCAGQQRRHRHKEQTFGHSGGRRGWDDLREWLWNIHITICKIDSQWEFDVWCRESKAQALWRPGGIGWGGKWERGSGGRGHVYTRGRFMLMYGKNHCNIAIILQLWCTGMTQRDGMGREEGGGFRMGNTCIPVADSFWYLAKLIQLCKV